MDENSNTPLVLAVDDNPANLQVLGSMLKRGGYRVAVAANGRQALDYVARKEPDLILLDVMMPDMDGFEVCRELRSSQKSAEIPVLFITALNEAESKLKGFEAGGDDYIAKPFAQGEVMARVRVFLERRMAVKELERVNQSLEEMNDTLEERVDERSRSLEKMQSVLMMQEKMAAMGQLAAGISHELNNPVNFVHTNFATLQDNVSDFVTMLNIYRGFVDDVTGESMESGVLSQSQQESVALIRKKEKDLDLDFLLEDIHDLFSESLVGFERITWIVNSMRNFSRKDDTGKRWEFDLNQGITDTLIIAKNEYKYHCKVLTELGTIRPVQCVPQQINEVLLNLIVNAAQAIKELHREEPGEIVIKTFMENSNVCCEITDDGPGIPDEVQKRIFEPFFTTKEVGKGTGLGLSLSYDIIVDKHGGELSVESLEGKGTTFRIVLPENA